MAAEHYVKDKNYIMLSRIYKMYKVKDILQERSTFLKCICTYILM